MPGAWQRLAFVAWVGVACGGHPSPPAAPTTGETSPAGTAPTGTAPSPVSGSPTRYVGQDIGVELAGHPERSTLTLPGALVPLGIINHADGWRLVIAGEDADLVLLLTDEAGVVTDELVLTGAGADRVLASCEEADIALARVSACAGDTTSLPATRSWVVEGGAMVETRDPVTCFCADALD